VAGDAGAAGKISPACSAAIGQVLGEAQTQMEETSGLVGSSVTPATGTLQSASRGHASHRARRSPNR
jgi:hypothetical protein